MTAVIAIFRPLFLLLNKGGGRVDVALQSYYLTYSIGSFLVVLLSMCFGALSVLALVKWGG